MKRLLSLIFMILLLMGSGTALAFDDVRSFELETNTLNLIPGQTETLRFKFVPEGAIGPVELNTEETKPDPNVATAVLNADSGTVTVTGVAPGTTKFCFSCRKDLLFAGTTGYVYLTVNVVSDSVTSLSSDITSINTIYTGKEQSNLVQLTVKPESAANMLRYSSDNENVARVVSSNSGATNFFIVVTGPGKTTVHFTAGSKKVDIPVTVESTSSGAAMDPVLPTVISKASIKSAYEKYIKPYNTAFQDGKILDCTIEGLTTSTSNYSDTVLMNAKDLKVAQDFTNFYRALAGVSPMTYTNALSTEAQYGATFMKEHTYGHDAADGIDDRASAVLHSSNIARTATSVSAINGWFNERNNNAGQMSPGHRSWMLDPLITNYGIARDNRCWVQSYTKGSAFASSGAVFAIPSSGYFPVEAFETSTDVWSLYLGTQYYADSSKVKVSVTNNKGETISLANNDLKNSNGTFRVSGGYGSGINIYIYPRKFVGDYEKINSTDLLKGQSFTVTVEGLEITNDKSPSGYNYVPCKPLTYTTSFFSIAEEGWNPHIDSFTLIDDSTGKPLESAFTMKVGETKTVRLSDVSPNTYLSEAELLLKNSLYDTALGSKNGTAGPNTYTLTAKATGSGTITFHIYKTPLEKNYQVTVVEADNNQTGNGSGSSGSGQTGSTGSGQNGSTGSSGSNSTDNSAGKVTIYRIYNSTNGEHLYTTDYNEVKTLVGQHGWTDEGVGWYAPQSGKAVYRLYNAGLQNHLYTTDMNEVSELTTKHGWTKDFDGKPLFYSGGDIPVYRVYNQALRGLHHLTTDENEYNTLPAHGWTQENVALNAVAKPKN